MGILDRFTTIVKANINELLDHAEDPAKMIDQYLVDLTESLAEVKKETAGVIAEKMRQMHDKLVSDIENLKSRRETIKAKVAVAKTQEKVAGFTSGSDRAESAIASFDRMEAKADRMLDTADAMAELNENPTDDIADLEQKYSSVADSAAVDDELARLKAEMGL